MVKLESGNILEAINLSKSYPGVQALDSVNFLLKRGEVHAIVGQNGAGKSTFIEILAGSIQPDSGSIIIDGQDYVRLDPSQSIERSIQTVHQDNQLIEELSVAENIYLYNLPQTKLGFVNISLCIRHADDLLDRLGIETRSNIKISSLTFVEKKLISIAKAFSRKAKILILDEPTASLDIEGEKILFDIIRRNAEKGLSIIYISHDLGEIFEVCDRVTVLKDGKKIAAHDVKNVEMETIVHEMIGRSSHSLYTRVLNTARIKSDEKLEIIDYSRYKVVDHVSFSVRKGEIFGIGGLVGSGRTELARIIIGLDKKDSGKLVFCGKDITPSSPYDSIKKGIGYLTENRKDDGLVVIRPIFENISMARFARDRHIPYLELKKERTTTEEIASQLQIKTPSISQLVINLSGGNQQKVVLAKWLYANSEIILFDEPTVGVDVGSKSEIYHLIDNLVQQGKIIIIISSDYLELSSVCDRVGIMRFGKLITILEGAQINEENILKNSLGVTMEDN